ncbi:MAG: ParB/RepB/Spo0J family partition protein [Bacilli bacterium]|nr:ParB/RepB/Spo0J family partition protein [Bacilli bacterium]
MSERRNALGKGLEQLFSDDSMTFEELETTIVDEAKKNDEIVELDLSELRPNPYQPRKKFDEEALNELADSIKEHGVFQPIIVKKSIKGYEIVAGERRYRASKKLGLEKIPAIIKDFTDDEMMQISLLENLQRENLTSIEEAKAYKAIIDASNLTQEELAKKVGKSRSYITNILGLLTLPVSIQNDILENKISMGHARVLSKIEDEDKIKELANKVISEGLSVRELEDLVKEENVEKKVKVVRTTSDNSKYKIVERNLKEKLGSDVKVSNNKITIKFSSDKDLNRILEILDCNIED